MSSRKDIIALVFDFDDTIIPDTTTLLLNKYGIDTNYFWKKRVKQLLLKGYDSTLAVLNALLDYIGENKPLGPLKAKDLVSFGASLKNKIFPGFCEFIIEVKKGFRSKYEKHDIFIEFYIISGGLLDIIEGCNFFKKHFRAIYASQLEKDPKSRVLKYIKRSITFTEKTRYLFEIHKGIPAQKTQKNPFLVNTYVEEKDKKIPWSNFIYVGDGLTDIPCISLIEKMSNRRATCFGIRYPTDHKSAKNAAIRFLIPKRHVAGPYQPYYRRTDDLGAMLRATLDNRCTGLLLERKT